jgi:lactate dehydrogenase-like 2-hydroxyacid dehydrogenase
MTFDTVMFKDKSDIVELVKEFPDCLTLGTYEKAKDVYRGVKILSVKSSKVGKTTLARFPNLEWVVCRSHGYDNINLVDCHSRNVGVVTTSPTAENCARWCVDKIDPQSDFIVLFGNGSIGSVVSSLIDSIPKMIVTSKDNDMGVVVEAINNSSFPTIIVTVPLNDSTKKMFTHKWLSSLKVPVQILSISRDDVFDDDSILKLIEDGKLRESHFDMASPQLRAYFTPLNRIFYHGHTSWKYPTPSNSKDSILSIVPALLENRLDVLPKNSLKLLRWI